MQQQGKEKQTLSTAFADSDEAVFDLLEALLQEVDELPETQVKTQPETKPSQEARVETDTEVKIDKTQPIESVTEAETPIATPQLGVAEEAEEEPEGTLPEWTRQPQQCLLFEVENTEIAIPLVVLNSIAVWDEEALSIPTQPDWHLGVIKHRDENIVIVDTARLIMPEKLTQMPEERRTNHGSHFLVINDRWALSCDAIKETILLKPEQVKWRPRRPTRPWAVGTLIDRLCVLLDTEALMQEIEQE